MYEVEPCMGRLVLVRWRGPLSMDEFMPFLSRVRDVAVAAPGRLVFCSDYRGAESFPSAALEPIVWSLLRQDNPRTDCSVFLLDEENSTLRAQVESMLVQSGHPGRKIFTAAASLIAWIAPRLDTLEQRRLHTFLARERSERPGPLLNTRSR